MFRHVLKLLALTLIVLPEPFTTGLGIALLAGLAATSGRKRLSKFKNMEELIKRSFNKAKRDGPDWLISKKQPVTLHQLKTDDTGPGLQPAETARIPYRGSLLLDNRRISARVLHHTLNNSFAQYEAQPGRSGKELLDVIGAAEETARELHTLKTDVSPDIREGRKISSPDGWKKSYYTQDEVVLHTLKTA